MTMTSGGARRQPARRWISAPALACLGATLLFAIPIRIAGFAAPEPVFALIPAFGWAALRPSIVAPVALLALGLALDLIWGSPLGLWPLCLIIAHAMALSVRRLLSGEDFAVLWVWYAATCVVAFSVGTLAMRLASGAWPTLIGVGLQALVSVALFPLAWTLIERYRVDEVRLR